MGGEGGLAVLAYGWQALQLAGCMEQRRALQSLEWHRVAALCSQQALGRGAGCAVEGKSAYETAYSLPFSGDPLSSLRAPPGVKD